MLQARQTQVYMDGLEVVYFIVSPQVWDAHLSHCQCHMHECMTDPHQHWPPRSRQIV